MGLAQVQYVYVNRSFLLGVTTTNSLVLYSLRYVLVGAGLVHRVATPIIVSTERLITAIH